LKKYRLFLYPTGDSHPDFDRALPRPQKVEENFMALIAAGAKAPDFKLESHLDTTVSLSDFLGSKNVLLVSYPLDFTPT